ncbi:hypothetical protein BGX26_004271, partial [Mortierella sp. AD094]
MEDIDKAVHAFENTLETLIVVHDSLRIDLQSPRFKYEYDFPKLTRFEACLKITAWPVQDSRTLMEIANFTALRSISIKFASAQALLPLWQSFPENGGSSLVESLSLREICDGDGTQSNLMAISLRKLWMEDLDLALVENLFKNLVFSKLEVLVVCYRGSTAEAELAEVEQAIAERRKDLPKQLIIYLIRHNSKDYPVGDSAFKEAKFSPLNELRSTGGVGGVSKVTKSKVSVSEGNINGNGWDSRRVKRYLAHSIDYL